LLSGRLLKHVMGVEPAVDDETAIPLWVDMVMAAIG
jgi:hypothetical protein